MRRQDVGLKTHLEQLDRQISELQLDVRRPCSELADSDSRPSSGSPSSEVEAAPSWQPSRGPRTSRARALRPAARLEHLTPKGLRMHQFIPLPKCASEKKGRVHVRVLMERCFNGTGPAVDNRSLLRVSPVPGLRQTLGSVEVRSTGRL